MEEKNHQNLVNFGFVLFGALAYYISGQVLEVLSGMFGAVARFRDIDMVKHGLPVAVGLTVFALLFFNSKVQVWAEEVVTEVQKVVWPSRKDTVAMTIVCCVMVVIAGIGLGLYDFLASQLIKVFVN